MWRPALTSTAAAAQARRSSSASQPLRHSSVRRAAALCCAPFAAAAMHSMARPAALSPAVAALSFRCPSRLSAAVPSSVVRVPVRRFAVRKPVKRPGGEPDQWDRTRLFLQGRLRLFFATPPSRWLGWGVLGAVALSLWIVKRQVWDQPHEHQLIAQATIMAERDQTLMQRINLFKDDPPKRKTSADAAAATTNDASSAAAAAAPVVDDDSLPTRFTDSVGILARAGKLTPRELRQIDPTLLRVGRVFDHRASFDFNLLESRLPAEAAAALNARVPAEADTKDGETAPAAATLDLASLESRFPGCTARSFDTPALPSDLFPKADQAALLKHLEDLTGSTAPNRLDLWSYLPDTNYGEGQLHVLGRKTVHPAKEKAATPVNKDGRFIIKPKPVAAASDPAAAASSPLEWEIVSMSLVFPQAQPQPLSFDLAPTAASFERRVGTAATPAHDDPSSRAAVTHRLAAFWLPSDVSVFSALKLCAYLGALLWAGKRVKNHPRLNPTDKALSFWCMNQFRTIPSIRRTFDLDQGRMALTQATKSSASVVPAAAAAVSRPLFQWRPTLVLEVMETAHEWDRASRFARPIELGGGYYPSADRNNLKLTYTLTKGYAWPSPLKATNSKEEALLEAKWNRVVDPAHDRAIITVEAQRIPMVAAFGLLRWRKFRILRMHMTSGRFKEDAPNTQFMYPHDKKTVEITDYKPFG